MADIATLGLRVDGGTATQTIKTFGDAADRASDQASGLEKAVARQSAEFSRMHNITINSTRGMSAFSAIEAEAAGHVGEHSLAVGRLERSMALLTERVFGLNPQLVLAAESLGHFALGSVEMVAILAGLAAISYAWGKITEDAKKANEEHDKYLKGLGEAANAAEAAKLNTMGRNVLYGQPFDDKGNLVENSKLVAGAFKGSLADMEATYAKLIAQVPKGVEYASGQLAVDINNLVHKLDAAREKFAEFQRASANLAAQPAGVPGQIVGMTSKAESNEAIDNEDKKRIADMLERQNDAMHEQRRLYKEQEDEAIRIVTEQYSQEEQYQKDTIAEQLDTWNDAMHQRLRLRKEEEDETIRIVEEQYRREEEAAKKKIEFYKKLGLDAAGLALRVVAGNGVADAATSAGSAAFAGFQAGGPWAAAAAAALSLTNSIINFGKSARDAAAQLAQASQSFITSFSLYYRQTKGVSSDLDAALTQAKLQHDAYAQQINDLYPGKKEEAYRNELLHMNDVAYQRNIDNIKKQTAALEAQAKVDALTPIINTLAAFHQSLLLSDQSTLSPTQKLEEARRQYQDILDKARAGDQTAASQLPQYAQAFLAASRGVNASGSAYQRDFQQVLRDNDEIQKLFEGQRDIAQQQLDTLKGIQSGNAASANVAHSDQQGTQGLLSALIQKFDLLGSPVQTEVQT